MGGEEKIKALKKSMLCAIENKVEVSVNLVILNSSHIKRIRNLLSDFPPQISIRIMRSLEDRDEATGALKLLLEQLGATMVSYRITAGVSDERYEYQLANRRKIWYKKLRNVRLPETCKTCEFNNDIDCHEGFYGIRLYKDQKGNFQVGVCIQRMDLCQSVDDFLVSRLADEIEIFQKGEYVRLKHELKRRHIVCPLNLKQK
jgi:cyclic pyranopterin phosphate synthase